MTRPSGIALSARKPTVGGELYWVVDPLRGADKTLWCHPGACHRDPSCHKCGQSDDRWQPVLRTSCRYLALSPADQWVPPTRGGMTPLGEASPREISDPDSLGTGLEMALNERAVGRNKFCATLQQVPEEEQV